MIKNFEELQKTSKENVDLAMKSFGAFSKGMQSIAVEIADFQKKAFEDGTAVAEKVLASKSADKAFEAQTTYARTAYDNFLTEINKVSELYMDATKEAFKPFETTVTKAAGK